MWVKPIDEEHISPFQVLEVPMKLYKSPPMRHTLDLVQRVATQRVVLSSWNEVHQNEQLVQQLIYSISNDSVPVYEAR